MSVGSRIELLVPFRTATGQYQQSKLNGAGTVEGLLAARLHSAPSLRPLTLYATAGLALGAEQAGTKPGQTPSFTDTEKVIGFAASSGVEMPFKPRLSLVAEVGYIRMRGTNFTDLRVEDRYQVVESGVGATFGFRYRLGR